VFLRRGPQPDGTEWWGFVLIGVILIGIAGLGLSGAFGELGGAGRFRSLVLFGIPLGVVALVIGMVKLFRDDGPRDDARPEGDRPGPARPDGPGPDVERPDGMIDR
jgi:hypothetical protein